VWDIDSSCTSDTNEELENWKDMLHEDSTLPCNMMTKFLHCISMEVRYLPHYDNLNDVNLYLDEFEREVPNEHQI